MNAGDKLNFFSFNYITSDAYIPPNTPGPALYSGTSTFDSYLFTARTTTSGNTVPGSTARPWRQRDVDALHFSHHPRRPRLSPWAASSERCWRFRQGCGYTGWIQMGTHSPPPALFAGLQRHQTHSTRHSTPPLPSLACRSTTPIDPNPVPGTGNPDAAGRQPAGTWAHCAAGASRG